MFEVDNGYGALERYRVAVDYLILADDLVLDGRRRCPSLATGSGRPMARQISVYEVMAPGKEAAWR